MCIIAVSKIGVRQPSLKELRTMYSRNPDGAGFMYAKDGKVHIHKGFMTWADFEREIRKQAFGPKDAVVYHFRISTQAGIKPTMTHPFPLTEHLEYCEALDLTCPIGVAHNGIISMTSFKDATRYSDTAYFIAWYMTKLIREKEDMSDPCVLDMIQALTLSKWAIMDGDGNIETVGKFETKSEKDKLLFSNSTYKPFTYAYGKYAYEDDEWDGVTATGRWVWNAKMKTYDFIPNSELNKAKTASSNASKRATGYLMDADKGTKSASNATPAKTPKLANGTPPATGTLVTTTTTADGENTHEKVLNFHQQDWNDYPWDKDCDESEWRGGVVRS